MIVVGDLTVNPNLCNHMAIPPVCRCIHDWRIEWGNVPKQGSSMPTQQTPGYVLDDPEEDVE